jgi:hypothetical protein
MVEEVSGLVRLALENKMPVEVLERLVALQERVTDRNARGEFFDALARFQESVPSIHKGSTAQIATKAGGKYSYTYAPLDAIAKAIREPLRAHGLSYAWTVEEASPGSLSVVCILRHIGGHEERAAFPVPVDTQAAMSGAQKNGAALTYGKRQSLTSVLGLTTTDDDTDGVEVARDTETITEAQAADLSALVEEVGSDLGKILAWVGVASLAEFPASALDRVTRHLEGKRGAA